MDKSVKWNVSFSVKVQSKTPGRLTIPKNIRDGIGLSDNDEFFAIVSNGNRTVSTTISTTSGGEIIALHDSELIEIMSSDAFLIFTIVYVSKNNS